MNFKGNTLLAQALFEQIDAILPERITGKRVGDPSPLTEAECAQRLAHTDWTRYNNAYKILNFYLKKPPFTNQLYHKERISRMEGGLMRLQLKLTPQVHQQAAALYEQLLEKEPSDTWLRLRYAELLSVHLGDESSAAKQCRLTQELLPHSYRPHLLLAMSLERQGYRDEAIEHLLRVIQIKPTSANAYHRLARAYQAQTRMDQAIGCYSQAIRLQPDMGGAYRGLALLLSQQGKVDEAIALLHEGTRQVPDDAGMHVNRGFLLNQQKHREEAIKELRIALQIDPKSTEARRVLDSILKGR
jgi:tetratricopeptide (TPR) repeat protein